MDILGLLGGLFAPKMTDILRQKDQAGLPADWQQLQGFIAKKDPIYDMGIEPIDPNGPKEAEQQRLGGLLDWLTGKSKSKVDAEAEAEKMRRGAENMTLGSLSGMNLMK